MPAWFCWIGNHPVLFAALCLSAGLLVAMASCYVYLCKHKDEE